MAEFRMPSLGADMDVGTVLEWLVQPGDSVRKGDVVAVVDTAKAAVEVETFVGGIVEDILVQPGQEVSVGAVLATIKDASSPSDHTQATKPQDRPIPERHPVAKQPTTKPRVSSPLVRRLATERDLDLTNIEGTGKGGTITRADVERAATLRAAVRPVATQQPRQRASPQARRLATELGIDLSQVSGTGKDSAVRAADVRAAAAIHAAERPVKSTHVSDAETATTGTETQKSTAMRTAIAQLMTRAKREIPHYYLSETVDLGETMGWLRERNRTLSIAERLVPAAVLLKATAVAALRHPELNGFWINDNFLPGSSVNLGVAISLRNGGLVAPALRDAADCSVTEVMANLRDLVARARTGRLRRTELADSTITVTNLGEQGVDTVFGVIYPPQVALVGFGRVADRAHAIDGLLGVRPVVTLTLAADHRATDGFTGSRFLRTINDLLQHPEAL